MSEKQQSKTTEQKEKGVRALSRWRSDPLLMEILYGMSTLINTRLSKEALILCIELLEVGVNAKVLAQVVLKILEMKKRREENPKME
ncbi:uncharacterized protein Dwil_GK14562 [Drosophila willistoni]|uniref:Mitotic-spindle organizing protein 1 n=1 Tax=Drosophila willistoni TaxID=7260 RepID=B4MWY9_DROWI|nr:mitotic-spindle organizing protein 1 [Drosophila willistoni]EDW76628.1 uncharacterized protein Dwil_GK14562 [Drosophila willistoni]